VDRSINLRIIQDNGTHTSIYLGRQLTIKTVPLVDFDLVSKEYFSKDSPKHIADARAEIKEVLEKTMPPLGTSFGLVEVKGPRHAL
jgi:hypothetical protein